MEPISRDEVLRIVKLRGPLIPNDLKKALGKGDTMLLGAVLSELASKGLVKISKTKLGGSPFYYDPANPASLERISQHLGEKDQRTYNLLKERKVLRDDTQEALTRVSLRNIKDFAIPLTVQANGAQLLFWKHYLVSDTEAEQLIKEALGMKAPETPKPTPRQSIQQPTTPPQPTRQQTKQQSTPQQTPTRQEIQEPIQPPLKKQATSPRSSQQHESTRTRTKPTQQPLPTGEIDDPFYARVKAYFDQHKIVIREQQLIRKRSELDFVVLLPTPVGPVEYYCKAKAKKKSNDGDLAAAKLQGQSRGLPVLYLTTGEITKKAKEKLQSDFKGLVVKELEG